MNLTELLDHLIAIEETVPAVKRVYRLRPRNQPGTADTPALVHIIGSGQLERDSLEMQKETVLITSRIVMPFSNKDADEDADRLLAVTESYLEVVDAALWNQDLPEGVANQRRESFQQGTDDFGFGALLCMDIRLRFELRRAVR